MKLISTTDFVLEQNKLLKNAPDAYNQYCKIVNYANFLKQPLKLEMFVPCDEKGNVLEEPEDFKYFIQDDEFGAYNGKEELQCIAYLKAKNKVLFQGIDLSTAKYHCDRNDRTIEYFVPFDVVLTPNAINQIFKP